jgi:hypothetical protein
MLMPKKLIDCMVENQNPELAKVVKHFHPKYLFPKMNFKGWFGERIWADSSEALYRDLIQLDQCIIPNLVTIDDNLTWNKRKKKRTITYQKLPRRKCSSLLLIQWIEKLLHTHRNLRFLIDDSCTKTCYSWS